MPTAPAPFPASGSLIQAALLVGLLALVGIAVVTDLKARRIPDWLTLPGLVLGVAVHGLAWGWATGPGFGLVGSVLGGGAAALPFLAMALWRPGSFGGGDIKLMAAVGSLLGWPLAADAVLAVAVAGGLHAALSLMVARGRPARGLPYALPIAAGAGWVALGTLAWGG